MHRQRATRHRAGEIEIGDANFDAIRCGRTERGAHITHDERCIVGGKVERRIPVLIIEAGVAAVVVQAALFHRDAAGMHCEQSVDGRI